MRLSTLAAEPREGEPVIATAAPLFANELSATAMGVHLTHATAARAGVAPLRLAVMVIELRRSDRASALAGSAGAQQALLEIRRRLSEALRQEDRFAVVGVEHVTVTLPNVANETLAVLAASRILSRLEPAFKVGARPVSLRAAIGCAFYPAQRVDAEGLIEAADHAAILARAAPNGISIFRSSGNTQPHHGLVEELRDALSRNELEVWLQPKVDVKLGMCTSAEALIRWPRAADKEQVHAGRIAELAENNGLMPALTQFVLNTALRQLRVLADHGITISVAVNVSASVLADSELPRQVAQSLATWGIAASRLTIEVTESSIMSDFEGALKVMLELKRLGTRLSIDDFGTGYSSLAYLRRMPLDELKIDQLFVRNILANPGDIQITRSVIDLSHNFGLDAVAEGVETSEAKDLLIGFGCDILQGYYFSKPVPLADLIRWWPDHAMPTI